VLARHNTRGGHLQQVICNRLTFHSWRAPSQVFLTGATSKIGKAIALYLSARGVKVNMLTPSAERFAELMEQAKPEHRQNLVHCTTVAQGSACDQWVVGKPLSPKEQQHAPKGAMFHQVRTLLPIPSMSDAARLLV